MRILAVQLDIGVVLTIIGIATPILTVAITKLHAKGWIRSAVAGAIAGAAAVTAKYAGTTGLVDVWDVLLVAVGGLGLAGGLRVSTPVGAIEAKVAQATKNLPGFGTSVLPPTLAQKNASEGAPFEMANEPPAGSTGP